ncbi:hypothetical protein HKCCSP123_02115 [Rhodobacterales bacterium HKCCSP123]|nr:hypothetical protein [Rhodobacterales bacterium HKCCSP123]
MVSDIPLDALYTRPTGRNQDSARPLSEARTLPIQFIGASVEDGDVASQVLEDAAGRSIIWIGNSTNLNPIWEMLGLPGEAPPPTANSW